ncbi:MAG TPA: glycosyltransferase family 4 protein [Pyrinomonadaceae bacterium]|jgi:glycosyltransferase involved in cell wall biosynthesis
MKKKLCYVISDIDTSHLIEATAHFTDREKFDVSFVFLGAKLPALYGDFKDSAFQVEFIECRGKADYPRVIRKLIKHFKAFQADIVHTHLFNATMTGIIAARLAGVRQRIHTRHHSVETHLYHPHAVYYDKIINFLSTHIVAITDMVAEILIEREKVDPRKVTVVRHGFDWNYFDEALASESDLRAEYGLTENSPVVGVISRYIHWKGLQYIIPAFKDLLKDYPQAKLVLANAKGPYKAEIEELLKTLAPENYLTIEFERRIFELYKTFDVFVHAPIGREYEAFGQVYIEPLAMRVPSVFTLSGVAEDFIEDKVNALVVPFCDSATITRSVKEILNDNELRKTLIENGQNSVKENFHARRMAKGLEKVHLTG